MTAIYIPIRPQPADLDAAKLALALAAAVAGEVRFDKGTRAVYSADASNYRQVPIGVVIPKSVADIEAAVRVCREFGAPVLPRGGGTSQNGQCVNVAVVIDNSKYLNHVRSIDKAARTADVEPGVVCDALRAAAEEHGLTFGPDPATHSRCTLGGMIGNNSCGAHSVMAGKTVENVEMLEVLTYDGARFTVGPTSDAEYGRIVASGGRQAEIYAKLRDLRERYAGQIRTRYPKLKRRVSGYNLDQLLPENGFNVARALVGSEGTCVTVLGATTKLVTSPPGRVLLVLGYRDIFAAGDAVPEISAFGPIAMEGLDREIIGGLKARHLCLDDIALLPHGEAWIMVEFGGATVADAAEQACALMTHLAGKTGTPGMTLVEDAQKQLRIWSIRETGASATALSLDPKQPNPIVGWEDAAVDPARLGAYLREFDALVRKYGYRTSLYGHFGDGCIHARITFEVATPPGIAHWRSFLEEAAVLVVKYEGSLSGEHGDGQAKAEFLPIMYGDELMHAFREFKAIWDPERKMNPGKLIDAYRVDENLRLGPDHRPQRPATRFMFPADNADFNHAVERCNGMGRCRSGFDNAAGAVMCPSYRASGEERYSTRGRARLLFEMLRGDVITEGWNSEAVKEALDHCLACKGCRSDCPTQVDMATWKAEFLSHYHETHRRPLQAYSMGMIGKWAPLAAKLPWLANLITQTPGLAAIARTAAGIAQQRKLPRLASRTFRAGFAERAGAGQEVLLWTDTFNNHFRPATLVAGAEVLAHAGCRVTLPPAGLCCGRPLYDFGMVDAARDQLLAILDSLAPQIAAGVPVVGLEPSCVSVFRDELINLLADDPRAATLSLNTYTLAEYLQKIGYAPPAFHADAVMQGHCHHKSVMGTAPDVELLSATGIRIGQPESGCCGMAGSFGFKPQHLAMSLAIGERALLPAVRGCGRDTLIVADGFSCREQIEQGSGRQTQHLAEVILAAIASAESADNADST
jgi:hypothetical protein